MPRRRDFQFQVTHTLADGQVLTDEEFGSHLFRAENNREFLENAAMKLDPTYAAVIRAQKRQAVVAARREKLRLERERIDRELGSL